MTDRWLKVIDQTRCIGCHACTTACKSENEVPLSVTRTYVKSVDVGVRLHPCQMTMDLYGLTTADFIDGLQPTLGAVSFIDMAARADITLFI